MDDYLIEIKTVKELSIRQEHIHQLIGYYILGRIWGIGPERIEEDKIKFVRPPYLKGVYAPGCLHGYWERFTVIFNKYPTRYPWSKLLKLCYLPCPISNHFTKKQQLRYLNRKQSFITCIIYILEKIKLFLLSQCFAGMQAQSCWTPVGLHYALNAENQELSHFLYLGGIVQAYLLLDEVLPFFT